MQVSTMRLDTPLDKSIGSMCVVHIRQGDASGVTIVLELGADANVSGLEAFLVGIRPDGARVEQPMSLEGTAATCDLSAEWSGACGNFRRAYGEVRSVDGSIVGSTRDFDIVVVPAADMGEVEAAAYKSRIDLLVEEAEGLVKKAGDADGAMAAMLEATREAAERAEAVVGESALDAYLAIDSEGRLCAVCE